jgi:phosphotransferase system IIB component
MATVADTILAQLGGQRFINMTGAKHFMSDDSHGRGSLTFKLPVNMTRDRITHVRIVLKVEDLYDVQALKVRGVNCTTVAERFQVMANRLQYVFTELTGLDTHL